MTRLVWDQPGTRLYEAGVDRGVLYPSSGPGVPWSGLISIEENPSGGDVEPLYYDGLKYMDVVAYDDYQATLEAFSAPEEFGACDGTQTILPGLYVTHQPRERFGLAYRSMIGNDLEELSAGYKIHLVYGCVASPSTVTRETLTNSTDPGSKKWELNTTPPPATTYKPTAHLVIDTTKLAQPKIDAIEAVLYGSSVADPSLPTQQAVIGILS